MEPKHREVLQSLHNQLLENITDYKGIIGGLYSENILTPSIKERVEQKTGTDQLRELLDILPKRGGRAFEVFHKVLVHCGESTAANLLFSKMAEQTEVKQKKGSDRLWKLLDNLTKRGRRTFEAFYQVLVECGEKETAVDLLCPELADQRWSEAALNPPMTGVQQGIQLSLPEEDELPAKWPDIASHDPFRVEVLSVPVNSGMKAQFDKAVKGSDSVYAMHKPARGVFLLISNEHFKDARDRGVDLQDRSGTEKDCAALEQLFKQLHFRVETKHDLSAEEMLAVFQQKAGNVEATDNCFACAVLTHGEYGTVYGVDGNTVTLEALKDAVADNHPNLIGKPKVFLIQACQGKKKDSGAPVMEGQREGDAASNTSESENMVQELTDAFVGIKPQDTTQSDAGPEEFKSPKSDIFIAMATVTNFVSWRNTTWGTWFVQAIVYIFSRCAHKYEINQLMTRVNKLVSLAEHMGFKQVSIYSSSLTSDFYFFPGLQHGVVESHSEVDLNMGNPPSQTAQPPQTPVDQRRAESGSPISQPTDGAVGGKLIE